jgi:hypothetical protein
MIYCNKFDCSSGNLLICYNDNISIYDTNDLKQFDLGYMDLYKLKLLHRTDFDENKTQICYSKDLNCYAVSENQKIKMYFLQNNKIFLTPKILSNETYPLTFYESKYIAFSEDKNVSLFDIHAGRRITITNPINYKCIKISHFEDKIITIYDDEIRQKLAFIDPRCKKIIGIRANLDYGVLCLPNRQLLQSRLVYSLLNCDNNSTKICVYNARADKIEYIFDEETEIVTNMTTSENKIAYSTITENIYDILVEAVYTIDNYNHDKRKKHYEDIIRTKEKMRPPHILEFGNDIQFDNYNIFYRNVYDGELLKIKSS